MNMVGQEVYTPHGKGRVVYELPNGTVLVQYHYGGGAVFRKDEVFRARQNLDALRRPASKAS
jgi:hypothetical protein